MSRVSFLHTMISGDRPYIRFENVEWNRSPRRFLFDAQFLFPSDSQTGWRQEQLWLLGQLFNAPEDATVSDGHLHPYVMELLRQDVERVAREVRRYYEAYASYPDAGNFHVAEMEYRRVQTQRLSFQRLLLTGYKCFSVYGESAGRAFSWFVGVWLVTALFYMYSGFSFGTRNVDYLLRPNLDIHWDVVGKNFVDFLHALGYSFVSLMPGYFRFSTPTPWPTPVTPFLVVTEAVLGVGLLTLFLLAIRRRFRR